MRLIDVSNVNGYIDWREVVKAGVHGAFIKATEGRTFDDSRFVLNRNRAKAVGIHVGAYHFARPDHNKAVDEARHFARMVGKLRVGELRPVLDYEVSTHLLPSRQAQWIRDFNHEIKRLLGVWPIFYSYPALIRSLKLNRPVGNGLWLASYGPNDGKRHSFVVPSPWRRLVAHQFTSRARIPSIIGYVDMNETASLKALLAHPVRGTAQHAKHVIRPVDL